MTKQWCCTLIWCLFAASRPISGNLEGILFPRESETRQVVTLDGLWNFAQANPKDPLRGFTENWYKKDISTLSVNATPMPVPSSYNDLTTDWKLRDHVGLVWYQRTFFIPKSWASNQRVWIRFGSVSYAAQVWINGEFAVSHEIGHLPFAKDITELLKFGKENRVTVACDNTLLSTTIPQGKIIEDEVGRLINTYTFDFFNYAGIDRPVFLYTTPETYIDDISILTDVNNTTGYVNYNISVASISPNPTIRCRVTLIDKNNDVVATSASGYSASLGSLEIPQVNLWWPYLMHENPGYMYKFQVEVVNDNGILLDKYTMPIGIRTLKWNTTSFLINDRPIYLHGFGRHEDSDFRGKGLDFPLMIRDYNLMKWMGANAFRTSHYPYAEEIMDMADELGFMVIDECPAVDIDKDFSATLLKNHKQSLTELIRRDKNRPSVIMWSAANEPRTQYPEATTYFKFVMEHIKTLDTTRPTTIVEAVAPSVTQSSKYVDIVCFNRYNGWYSAAGNLETISLKVQAEAQQWHNNFNKPVILQEYGADTIEGLHFQPNFIWSEEYQVELFARHFQAFDDLRKGGYFIGEFVWNFADFKTAQNYIRAGSNKKGLFTRNRQPKASAFHVRRRYWQLANELYNVPLPNDLYPYTTQTKINDEL